MPNAALLGEYVGGIEKDFVLPNSYRNPRMILMTAHGAGLGLYSANGIVDILEDRASWSALGYHVEAPPDKVSFAVGDKMVVERPVDTSRNSLEELLRANRHQERELVSVQRFANVEAERAFVVDEIERLVNDEKVEPAEIFVITLNLRTSEADFTELRALLNERGINSATPGYIESASAFKLEDCITLTTPYRAKGNESNVVFVLNCQRAAYDVTLRARTAMFVSITRSRGWCYITGNGEGMIEIEQELHAMLNDYPRFRFDFPSPDVVQRRRRILQMPDDDVEARLGTLDSLVEREPELVIEKILATPELLRKIRERTDLADS